MLDFNVSNIATGTLHPLVEEDKAVVVAASQIGCG
jgi:hypothetical protein